MFRVVSFYGLCVTFPSQLLLWVFGCQILGARVDLEVVIGLNIFLTGVSRSERL